MRSSTTSSLAGAVAPRSGVVEWRLGVYSDSILGGSKKRHRPATCPLRSLLNTVWLLMSRASAIPCKSSYHPDGLSMRQTLGDAREVTESM